MDLHTFTEQLTDEERQIIDEFPLENATQDNVRKFSRKIDYSKKF